MKRSCYLDNVCWLLILHMIYTCHIASACGAPRPILITQINTTLSFFMAWFFFKGGMMHKKQPQKELMKKSAKRLLVPYAIFLLLGLLLDSIIKFTTNDHLTIMAFLKSETIHFLYTAEVSPVAASWFLLSLFVVRLVFNKFCSLVRPIYIFIFFVSVAFGLSIIQRWGLTKEISVMGYSIHILIPHYLGNICHGLALYSLGYYLREKQFNRVLFISALVLFVLRFIIPAGIDFRANTPFPSSNLTYILAVIYEVAGCIVINNIFKRFIDVKIPFITYIGSNSMVYYLVHYPVMYTTKSLFTSIMNFDWWVRFFILSCVVTVFLIIAEWLFRNKRLKFVIGAS